MTHAAVISGDLIRSRRASAAQLDDAFAILTQAAAELTDHLGTTSTFTRYRGDGWQLLLPAAGTSLLACVYLHARLRGAGLKIDTRMAVGLGDVSHPGTSSLADARGTAFEISGHTLDTLGKDRLGIAGAGVTDTHKALFELVAHIIFGWTAPQAEAMALQLLNTAATQDDLARQLDITRQAVQLRLAGAGKSPILAAVGAIALHDFEKDTG